MLTWLSTNLATIIICIILAAIVGVLIGFMIKNKRQGKSSCGGNCACCPMSGGCHPKK